MLNVLTNVDPTDSDCILVKLLWSDEYIVNRVSSELWSSYNYGNSDFNLLGADNLVSPDMNSLDNMLLPVEKWGKTVTGSDLVTSYSDLIE